MQVVDHVQGHLDEDLSPDRLADVAGFSRHHFHRVFKGMVGETVMGFVRRLRLERAASRLRFGEESVTRVAFEAGYNSHEAFTRAFRARFGVPPSAYRNHVTPPPTTSRAIEIRDEPPRACVCMRFQGPYAECQKAWEQLYGWAVPAGVAGRATDSLGLCFDDPEVTAAEHLRYDACLAFDDEALKDVAIPPQLRRRTVPGGRYAVALHRGSYDDIDETYVALLGRWLPHRGVELCDEPVVERYLTSPFEVPPDELLTEICVRLD